MRSADRTFSTLGAFSARNSGIADDGCRASCMDWYGNARPIFLGNRSYALMGYEIVEGKVRRGRVREIGRTDFTPRMRNSPSGAAREEQNSRQNVASFECRAVRNPAFKVS